MGKIKTYTDYQKQILPKMGEEVLQILSEKVYRGGNTVRLEAVIYTFDGKPVNSKSPLYFSKRTYFLDKKTNQIRRKSRSASLNVDDLICISRNWESLEDKMRAHQAKFLAENGIKISIDNMKDFSESELKQNLSKLNNEVEIKI